MRRQRRRRRRKIRAIEIKGRREERSHFVLRLLTSQVGFIVTIRF